MLETELPAAGLGGAERAVGLWAQLALSGAFPPSAWGGTVRSGVT